MLRELDHPIRILIVDDHPVVRAGLASMLATIPGLAVVGSAPDGKEALAIISGTATDIVLLDLRMPRLNGIEMLKALRTIENGPRAIILTSYESDENIYQAIQSGAYGYLLKACAEEEMLSAIYAVSSGERYLPMYIASRLAERIPRSHQSALHAEILDLFASETDGQQAAKRLHISVSSLWLQFNEILDRLDPLMPAASTATGRVTIADIARKAGVSMATVSRVLHNKGKHSEETCRAVMKVVNQYDFELNGTAASLAMMRTSSSQETERS